METITTSVFGQARPGQRRHKTQHEARLQAECVRWYRLAHQRQGEPLLFHIPNGGKRNVREAAHFKAMGVVAGVPDLFLAASRHGFAGLFIEMKAGKNGESAAQKEVRVSLMNAGYLCEVCRSFDEFRTVIGRYLQTL